jgi:HD-like signal output (HDOD) protein
MQSLTQDSIIALGNRLAPAAATFGRLRMLLSDTDADLHEVIRLVRLDPALTFHVVRLSNSVIFGFREKADSLDVAIGRVGFNQVFRLVGLAAVQQVCQRDLGAYRLPARRLWENAVATAAAAEVLAGRAGRDPGVAYSAGLLRTIGRTVLDGVAVAQAYPGEAEWPVIAEWERKTFGVSSTEVAATLLAHWRFPAEIIESIEGHGQPFADPDRSNPGACVLNLACLVAARFGLDLPGEAGGWQCTPAKLTLAGVTEADLVDCADRARSHYAALCSSLA